MLALWRKHNETIMIGNDVRITVIKIRGNKVRLGVDAPLSVPVYRQEIYDSIQIEKEKSTLQKLIMSCESAIEVIADSYDYNSIEEYCDCDCQAVNILQESIAQARKALV